MISVFDTFGPNRKGEGRMDSGEDVFLSNAVQQHVRSGGTVRYEAALLRGKLAWRLFAVWRDGTERPVISATSGRQRVFQSADTLVRYHLGLFPQAEGLHLPLAPTTGNSKDNDLEE